MGQRLHWRLGTPDFCTQGSTNAGLGESLYSAIFLFYLLCEEDNRIWLPPYIRAEMLHKITRVWNLWTKGILGLQIAQRYYASLMWEGKVPHGSSLWLLCRVGDFDSDSLSVFVFCLLPWKMAWSLRTGVVHTRTVTTVSVSNTTLRYSLY